MFTGLCVTWDFLDLEQCFLRNDHDGALFAARWLSLLLLLLLTFFFVKCDLRWDAAKEEEICRLGIVEY